MRSRYLQGIWAGIAIQLAGRLVDFRWHSAHDGFEGAADQLEAHWLAWIGIAVTAVAATLAVTRAPRSPRSVGYSVTFLGCALYIPVAAWHFIEHASGNDPELAHALIAVALVTIFAGAIIALVQVRRARSRGEET